MTSGFFGELGRGMGGFARAATNALDSNLEPPMMKLFGGKKEARAPEPEAQTQTDEAQAAKSGFFGRMKQAVARTRETLSSKIGDIVALTRTVDESALEDLEAALLTSDLGVQTTSDILDALRDRARHQAIEGGAELRTLLKAQLQAILEAPRQAVPAP